MMVESNDCIRQYKFEIRTPVLGVIALGVGLCGISLGVIAMRLGPLSRQAIIWNGCIETTSEFLSALPDFAITDSSDIKAMAVNLFNGSTPQKVENL